MFSKKKKKKIINQDDFISTAFLTTYHLQEV